MLPFIMRGAYVSFYYERGLCFQGLILRGLFMGGLTLEVDPLTLLQSPLPGLHHHLLQHQGLAAVQVRNVWGVVLTWFGAMFYVLCVQFSAVIVFLCRMSNIIDYLDDNFDREVEMETDDPPAGDRTMDIQTSESEQEDLGDEIEEDFLCTRLIQRSSCQA